MEITLRPATGGGTWQPALRGLRGGAGRRPLTIGGRWLSWAARLIGRYSGSVPAWNHLDTVLGRAMPVPSPGPGGTMVIHVPGRQMSWPLNLTLHLTIPAAQKADPVLRQLLPPTMQMVETSLARLHRREVWTNTHETELVTRLLTRQTRQEAAGMTGDWTTPMPAPARVFNHPTVAPRADTAPAAPPSAPPSGLQYWDEAARSAPVAAMDVEQVTDQVLRSIDQRVIAARERLGKR